MNKLCNYHLYHSIGDSLLQCKPRQTFEINLLTEYKMHEKKMKFGMRIT